MFVKFKWNNFILVGRMWTSSIITLDVIPKNPLNETLIQVSLQFGSTMMQCSLHGSREWRNLAPLVLQQDILKMQRTNCLVQMWLKLMMNLINLMNDSPYRFDIDLPYSNYIFDIYWSFYYYRYGMRHCALDNSNIVKVLQMWAFDMFSFGWYIHSILNIFY